MTRLYVAVLVLGLFTPASASAQALEEPPLHRLQVSFGGGIIGGAGLGVADANLRANATTPQPFRLFTADSELGSTLSLDFRAGVSLTTRIGAEAGVSISHPELRSALSADAEGAPSLTVVEGIDQYLIEGSVIIRIDELRLGRRTVPFVAAGAGYLRQLHEGLTVVENGHLFHVGGGVRHWLTIRRQGIRALGIRADSRLYFLSGGVSLNEDPRPHVAVSGSLVVAF